MINLQFDTFQNFIQLILCFPGDKCSMYRCTGQVKTRGKGKVSANDTFDKAWLMIQPWPPLDSPVLSWVSLIQQKFKKLWKASLYFQIFNYFFTHVIVRHIIRIPQFLKDLKMARAEKHKQLCNTNNIGPNLGPKCIFLKAEKLCHNGEVALQFLEFLFIWKCHLPQYIGTY